MATIGELGSEIFVDVSGVAGAGEQNNGPTSAAPVEDFEFNPIADVDESRLWFRSRSNGHEKKENGTNHL
jgi:hypothetical protein